MQGLAILRGKGIERIMLWLSLATLILVSYAFFFYYDLYSVYDNSIVLLRGLWQGRSLLDYFDYCIELSRTPWSANYQLFLYLIIAIWNLPVLPYCKLRGIDYLDSTFGHLWFKLLILVALAVAVWLMVRMLRRLGCDRRCRATTIFLFLSGPALIASVLIYSNVDIIAVCFMLAGIDCLMQGRQWRFLVLFALAGACKSFSFFLVIPLILLIERNVVRAALKMLLTTTPLILERVILSGSAARSFAMRLQSERALALIFEGNTSRTSFFVVTMIGLCVYCYLNQDMKLTDGPARQVRELSQRQCRTLVYLCLAVFGSFVTFVFVNEYWTLLALPFLALACATTGALMPGYYVLGTVGSIAYTLNAACYRFGFNEGPGLVSRSLLPSIVDMPAPELMRYGSPSELLESLSITDYQDGLMSVYTGCMVILLVLTAPRVVDRLKGAVAIDPRLGHVVPWARIGATALLVIAIIHSYLAPIGPVLFSNLSETAEPADVNLIVGGGHELTQELSFDEPHTLDRLVLRFEGFSPTHHRMNFASITVELRDAERDDALWGEVVGVGLISKDRPIHGAVLISGDDALELDLGGVDVGSGTYELRISGTPGTKWGEDRGISLSPLVVPGATSGLAIDGQPMTGTLQYEIR